MAKRERPLQIESRTFQHVGCASRNVIQAIEPEAEQLLVGAGGKVLRNDAGSVYTEYWDGGFPTVLIVWPPNTSKVYLAPIGQEDRGVIFMAARLPGSQGELHLIYDYRPGGLFGLYEEYFTLQVARVRVFAERESGDERE